ELPRHRRDEVIAAILRSPSSCRRAVHGYDLSEGQAASLRMHGVAVEQHLQFDLFRSLCRTCVQALASKPRDDGLSEETWIDLAEQPASLAAGREFTPAVVLVPRGGDLSALPGCESHPIPNLGEDMSVSPRDGYSRPAVRIATFMAWLRRTERGGN